MRPKAVKPRKPAAERRNACSGGYALRPTAERRTRARLETSQCLLRGLCLETSAWLMCGHVSRRSQCLLRGLCLETRFASWILTLSSSRNACSGGYALRPVDAQAIDAAAVSQCLLRGLCLETLGDGRRLARLIWSQCLLRGLCLETTPIATDGSSSAMSQCLLRGLCLETLGPWAISGCQQLVAMPAQGAMP